MHTIYREHKGSYAVVVPQLARLGTSETQWRTLFSGLSLGHAIRVVHYLNGGEDKVAFDAAGGGFLTLLEECAA